MAWFVDFVGLNSLVSSSANTTTNTITSGKHWHTAGPAGAFGIREVDEAAAINIHRNGPYGWPSWKQVRIGENRISRYHKANSDLSYVKEPGELFSINVGSIAGRQLFLPNYGRQRKSALISKKEPAVCQKTYPLTINMSYRPLGSNGQPVTTTIGGTKKYSPGLQMEYFANKSTNVDHRIPTLSLSNQQIYKKYTGYYLGGKFLSPN